MVHLGFASLTCQACCRALASCAEDEANTAGKLQEQEEADFPAGVGQGEHADRLPLRNVPFSKLANALASLDQVTN